MIFTEKREKHDIIRILAKSDVGAMYACLTLRCLINKRKGELLLACAKIKDWPDFKYRTLRNYAFMKGYRHAFGFFGQKGDVLKGSEITRELIDELMGMKINMMSVSIDQPVSGTATGMFFEGAPLQLQWFKEMIAYAKKRGIKTFFCTEAVIDRQFSKDTPRNDFCVSLGNFWRTSRFCWSSDDLLRKAASKLSQFIEETGIDAVYLHCVDTHNQKWESRCEKCRARFKNNQQGDALANVFKIYIEEIKKKNPEALVAIIPRPYHGFDLNNNLWLKKRIQAISGIVPKGTYTVHTGMTRKADESWERSCGGFILDWLNVGCFYSDGKPLSSDPQVFFLKTHFLNSENICHFNAVTNKLQRIWASSSMWNTDFPLGNKIIEAGKEYHVPNRENCSTVQEVFNGKGNINIWQWAYKGKPVDWLDTYKEMSEDSDVRKILIRLCGDLYGGQLAECMSEALLSGYLPPYTNNPEIWKFRSVNYINSYDKYNLQSMKKYNDRMTKAAAPFGTFLKNRSLPSVKSKEMQCEIWNVMFDLLEEKTKSAFWVILLTRKEKNNGVSEKELNETFDREVKSVRNILDLYKKFPADIKSEAKINRRILGLTKWLEHISMLDMSARMENNSDYPAPELVVNDNPEMRIAIYNPNSLGGKAYGFKPLFNTLNGSSGTEVSYINFISKESIKDFDCIYFPQVNKFGEKDDASSFFKDLRDFCKKGGNIYMLHDSVGYNRFALGCPVFSELASKIIMEKGDSYCTAVKHPLTSGIEPGTTLKHMYLDHFLLKDLKKAEAILINKNGDPVVAAARWGKGKIILDGTIPYGEKSECENAKDFNKQLIINSIEWFRSNKPEDLIVENSRVNVVRKTEHDAVHYYLEFFPRVISRNNFTGQVLEIGIADKKSNNIYSKSISLPQKERIWQPEETKMIFDLPVDPTGKYLVLKIIDKDGSEILSRKYIVMR